MDDDVRSILERARKRNREAFGQLVKRYQHRVYMIAFRLTGNHDDAHDVAQETFIHAFEGLADFDERCDFFTWLYRISVNVSLNNIRRKKRHRITGGEEVFQNTAHSEENADAPDSVFERRDLAKEITLALTKLSDSLRTTMMLVLVEGCTYREVAEILQCSEGTVAWRVHEARQVMRDHLAQYVGRGSQKANK